jgi:hypothetical protein
VNNADVQKIEDNEKQTNKVEDKEDKLLMSEWE